MAEHTDPAVTCPNCGAQAGGRFCNNCGAALKGVKCGECNADLVAGAKFCHRCGASAGAIARRAAAPNAPVAAAPGSPAASGFAAAAPWAVAGIAIVTLIALVASRRFGADQPAVDAAAPATLAGPAAVDISGMSPRERAERLFNRIMRLDGEGKKDSVQFFAPMAISAYGMIPDPDADTHYDLGRVAEVAGALPFAKAQADTILAKAPTNLLGLALAMRVARDMGNANAAAGYAKRLRAAAPAERKKNEPGYEQHALDLDQALKDAAR